MDFSEVSIALTSACLYLRYYSLRKGLFTLWKRFSAEPNSSLWVSFLLMNDSPLKCFPGNSSLIVSNSMAILPSGCFLRLSLLAKEWEFLEELFESSLSPCLLVSKPAFLESLFCLVTLSLLIACLILLESFCWWLYGSTCSYDALRDDLMTFI